MGIRKYLDICNVEYEIDVTPVQRTNYQIFFKAKNQLIMNIKWTILCLTFSSIISFSSLFASNKDVKVDSVAPLSISGQVDAFFKANSNGYTPTTGYGKTSYTGQNGFGLGMANIAFAKDNGKIGFVADVMFGTRAEETNYNYSGSAAFLKQLYVTYKPVDALKFTIGNFMTYFGYELVEASNNLNYSMSYCYTNGPFFHTGLKVDYAVTSKLGVMAGIFSQTDTKGVWGINNPSLATTGKKFVGGQVSYLDGAFKIYLNALTGSRPDSVSTTTLDLTTSYQVTPELGLGLNVLSYSESYKGKSSAFLGTALYVNYAFAPSFTLAARGEIFSDKDGLKYKLFDDTPISDNSITAFTLSGNFKIDAFTIIPEVRIESAGKKIWQDDKGVGQTSETSFILAAIYKF